MTRTPIVEEIRGDTLTEAFLSPWRWGEEWRSLLERTSAHVREFELAGTARVFTHGAAGHDRDYRTRVLSILPRAEDFSGVVHVELLNPSVGIDFPLFFPDFGHALLAAGDAYVGITCKSVTARGLSELRPDRYGRLRIENDSQIWDIVSQLGAVLREPRGGGLLPGLADARTLLATGWSQSGSFLRTYLSEGLHDAATEALGAPVFDGYLIGVSSGGFGPMGYVNIDRDGEMEFDADLNSLTEVEQLALDDERRVVRNIAVPVMEVMSEDEVVHHFWHHRPDSDAAGDLFRTYQIPGRGHDSGLMDQALRADDLRESGTEEYADADAADPRHTASRFLFAAILDHLKAWTLGVVPPRADPIQLEIPYGHRPDLQGVDYSAVASRKDERGFARGGVRSLDVDLPVARSFADPDGPLTMKHWRREPFSAQQITDLYGDRAGYEQRVTARLGELVEAGWYRLQDAPAALREALAAFDAAVGADGRMSSAGARPAG